VRVGRSEGWPRRVGGEKAGWALRWYIPDRRILIRLRE
jgi:hypothetical protein